MLLKEFIINRKFKILTNKSMSEDVDVTSGVPKGAVLAAIKFLIMISDIGEVRYPMARSFADNT